MAAHPAPPSSIPPVDPQGNAPDGKPEQLTDSLIQKILKSGPPWLRWTALVLAALAPYARYPVSYFQQRGLQNRVSVVNPYSLADGTADLSKTDPATRVQLAKQAADNQHIVWHQNVKNESPPLVPIFDSNQKGFLAYKVFDSDGCILVERAKGALSSTTLVRALNNEATGTGSPVSFDESPLLPSDTLGDWGAQRSPAHEARLLRTQAGCLNPHPGQFRFWYGTPTDQCWVPMFRQFTDGCTHYQMFNRCNGATDGQIHWTQCVPRHFW